MTQSTRKLVESAVHGDRTAVDELLERFLPGLHAFVRLRSGRLLLAKESSSDLVQSICREVLADLKNFQYEDDAHFKHWLYVAALRKIANRYEYYRAGKRDVAKEFKPGAASGSDAGNVDLLKAYRAVCSPSQHVVAREEIARIEGAFDRLPEDYREVILLSRVVGLSHAEIAKKMERNEGAVRTLLSRALARLATMLEGGDRDRG